MVDTSVSTHGGHWPGDFLTALKVRCGAGLVLCAALLVSCSGDIAERVATRQPSDFPVGGSGVTTAIERVLESAVGYQTPKGPVRWPEDSLPHPTNRTESWQLMALVQDANGVRYSVLQQLDRIGLRDANALDQPAQDSGWRFRDVMRGRLHVLSEAEPRRDWDSVQRVALGLAGAERSGKDAVAAQINVGSNRLEIEVMPDLEQELEQEQGAGERCPMRFQMTMLDSVQLEFNQQQCAESNAAGPLRVVTSASLPVEGEIIVGRLVHGTGWIRQVYGDLPGAGSPVVFDNILVELEGVGQLVISRSKRRSGQGPATLEAHVHGKSSVRFEDLVWSRDELESGAEPIPSRWRLQSASNQLDVTLEPVSRDAWIDGPQGAIWRGAVSVSGSHSGVGFVDFQSVMTDTESE